MQWTLRAEKRLLIYTTLAGIAAATWHFIDLYCIPHTLEGTPELNFGPIVYPDEIAVKSALLGVFLWSAVPVVNVAIGVLLKSTARVRPFTQIALLHAVVYALYALGGASHDMSLYIVFVPIIGAVLFFGILFGVWIMLMVRRAINAPFKRAA